MAGKVIAGLRVSPCRLQTCPIPHDERLMEGTAAVGTVACRPCFTFNDITEYDDRKGEP